MPTTPVDSSNASDGISNGSAEQSPEPSSAPRLPSLRSTSDPVNKTPMTSSSTPLGMLNNARRPGPPSTIASRGGGLPQDMQAKMKAFQLSRQGTPPARPQMQQTMSDQTRLGGPVVGGLPGNLRMPNMPNMRPQAHNFVSSPVLPGAGAKGGLSARRGLKLPGGLPGAPTPGTDGNSGANGAPAGGQTGSMFNQFSNYVDTKNGTLRFAGKAVIHSQGIDFTSGNNFSISLDEVDTLEELGKGNYGTVYKVRHARPRIRRPGAGLAGNKAPSSASTNSLEETNSADTSPKGNTSGVVMAMKEIRLELDEAKFSAIIMELDILHRCISPYIIDFYGAFFQEGAVYICIEFMDGGSIDKLYGQGIPENVLRKITYSTVQGLKTLKDEHNIIHRDVKPTNILVNTKGQVKICDFGVSGNLVASIAKTNIGCQSYMAPERISGGGVAQAGANPGGGTYSVQSDIWSLGLTIIECALGRYPYPPETYDNIFSQLSAIVDGDPPDLPSDGYSTLAQDFVRGCLNKIPKLRPTYAMLLQHGWLAPLNKPATISEDDEDDEDEKDGSDIKNVQVESSTTEDQEVAEWVIAALERRKNGQVGESKKPALHAAPLDSISPVVTPG
ncbi:kinase-like domain-containing protein [Xylogone sp. PMI_703]|nr:kinase-like domain-containing protein [Xylogone sp. PMI_703]